MANSNTLLSEALILEITEDGAQDLRIIIPDNSEATVKLAIGAVANELGYVDAYCTSWQYDGHVGSYHDGVRWAERRIEVIRIQSLRTNV